MLRRAILLVTGTATAVTGALVYNPPQLSSVATDSLPIAPSPGAKNPTAKPTPVAPPQNNLPAGVFTGNTTNTRWGPVQV